MTQLTRFLNSQQVCRVGINVAHPALSAKFIDTSPYSSMKNQTIKRVFRKYHRSIALITALPIALTVCTGMIITVVEEWPINTGISSHLLLGIHTGEIFHLQAIYPILNGMGLIGLIVTGLSMAGVFDRKASTSVPRQ